MPNTKPTTDHREIRAWAAVHGALPVEIAPVIFDSAPSKLGFVFLSGTASEPEFKPIEWDHFFALFDLLKLSLVLDQTAPGSYEIVQLDGRDQVGFAIGPT